MIINNANIHKFTSTMLRSYPVYKTGVWIREQIYALGRSE
jgi:hypothetical protein